MKKTIKKLVIGLIILIISSAAVLKAAYIERGYMAAGGEILLIIALGVLIAYILKSDIKLLIRSCIWEWEIREVVRGEENENATKDI